jgi:hypothetical protein
MGVQFSQKNQYLLVKIRLEEISQLRFTSVQEVAPLACHQYPPG